MIDGIPDEMIGKKPLKGDKVNPFYIQPPTNKFHQMPLVNATEKQLQKICIKCHHTACPFCGDWCDNVFGEDMCCDGRCTY